MKLRAKRLSTELPADIAGRAEHHDEVAGGIRTAKQRLWRACPSGAEEQSEETITVSRPDGTEAKDIYTDSEFLFGSIDRASATPRMVQEKLPEPRWRSRRRSHPIDDATGKPVEQIGQGRRSERRDRGAEPLPAAGAAPDLNNVWLKKHDADAGKIAAADDAMLVEAGRNGSISLWSWLRRCTVDPPPSSEPNLALNRVHSEAVSTPPGPIEGNCMNATEMIQRLHQHRAWVNRNLLDAAVALSDEQLKATFPIGQGSVWKSLLHMYGAEYVWFESLQGNEQAVMPGDVPGQLPGNQLGEGGIADLPDLRQKWETLERRYTDYLAGLSPDALDETVTRYSIALQIRLSLRRSDVLLHVCTHAHYTVAQVVNMLRQCGATSLPQTMLTAMARVMPPADTVPSLVT